VTGPRREILACVDGKPRRLDLEAARDRVIPDVLPAPGDPLAVLFCGINPSLYSAATGWHFARPGNRFWPALYLSGFTPRQLSPAEQDLLPGYGLGITNLVARATAQAAEVTAAEFSAGGERLAVLVREYEPAVVAVAGVTAYRQAFGEPKARIGPQLGTLAGARIWILPNPSGLNAHWTLSAIAAEFAALRVARELRPRKPVRGSVRSGPPLLADTPGPSARFVSAVARVSGTGRAGLGEHHVTSACERGV
jgi:TDG/mug DNA glycosylase family protein